MNKSYLYFIAPIVFLSACSSVPKEGRIAEAVDPALQAAATAAENNHDYAGAVQHLSTLYARHPQDLGLGLALARNLRHNGQGQTGADVMQTQLATHSGDADLLLELGKDYLAADRTALAVRILTEARQAAPQRAETLSVLGAALDTQGNAKEALAVLTEAARLDPENPAVLNNLGLCQAAHGQLEAAIGTLRMASDMPTAGMQIRQNLALLLALHGDLDRAETITRHDLPAAQADSNVALYRRWASAQ